jgi:uncharacterized RDD family membrane protein YckC
MALADPGQPSRDTGLPPGVEVGPLGRRIAAYLIEAAVPSIVGVVLFVVLPDASTTVRGVLSIVSALVVVGWSLLIWYLLAERAAGPGMRLMHLQLVGFYDGRPIGWVGVLLRAVIFLALSATGIGLVLLLVFLLLHPRKQGWHDRAVKAVVIKERVLAPTGPRPGVAQHVNIAPDQPQERAYTPPPMYGPVNSYSPVPGGPIGPAAPVESAPAGVPVPQGPPPQPLAPPPGLSYPPQAEQPYAPVRPERPVPAAGLPHAPSRPNEPRAGQTRPLSAPSAPPAAEPAAEDLDWHAVLDDGRRVVVDHLVLLGRNPQPDPGEEDAQLIKIADSTRTVSKTHLAIGVDGAGLYVVDRGSTNGSTVTTPGGATRRCVPGETAYVSAGSIVSMGDHWLEVRRGNR